MEGECSAFVLSQQNRIYDNSLDILWNRVSNKNIKNSILKLIFELQFKINEKYFIWSVLPLNRLLINLIILFFLSHFQWLRFWKFGKFNK